MQIFRKLEEWFEFRDSLPPESVGFVPTMGALHDGHVSLLNRSRQENSLSVLSIYVNPTQFNRPEDLEKYPVTFEEDCAKAEAAGVDAILAPSYDEIYPDGFRYKVVETDISKQLDGEFRPGHFDGVLTVVMKMFQIVQPDRAYFGEKDYQQLILVNQMVSAFFLPVEIVPCATIREADGLAMSSRNVRLSDQERALAPELFRALSESASEAEAISRLEASGFTVDYVHDMGTRRFGAATLGSVRLMDNVQR